MMKKVVIVGLIFASLLIVSTFSVHAADEEKIFTGDDIEPKDDVIGPSGETTNLKPNIDIVKIIYEKVGDEVTLTLYVKGAIQNKGDINTINDETISPYVLYLLMFSTFDHTYNILYVNEKCNFTVDESDVNENIDFSNTTSALTFTFNLRSEDETYGGLYVLTMDVASMADIYLDEFTNTPEELTVIITAPSEGEVGQSISFSATVSGGTSYEYEWDFNEDLVTDSTGETPTYTYQEEGTYNVTLYVTDSAGGIGYDETTITITAGGAPSSSSSSGSGLIPFIVLIVVIVVAGVAVVVYFMRR